jgi:hypothetical protein
VPRKATEVTIQLQGGLGNQLFSYFAGLYLSLKLEAPLKIDPTEISRGFTNRDFDLNDFHLPAAHRIESRNSFMPFVIRNRLRWYFFKYMPFGHKIFFVSNETGRNREYEVLRDARIVRGYFQSPVYVNYCLGALGALGLELKIPSKNYETLSREIKKSMPIVVHVRRRGYLRHSNSCGLLSVEYFSMALSVVSAKLPTSPIWVFTDSDSPISDYERHFTINRQFGPDVDLSPAETLLLMSQGAALVISNSTFSWWAAYLSKSGTPIVAPSKWFKNLPDPNELFPEDWIRVTSHWVNL